MVARIPEECDRDVATFIDRCIAAESCIRPTAKEILFFLAQQLLKRSEMVETDWRDSNLT